MADAKEKKTAEKKPRVRKSVGKFALDARITFGTDKEGKPYGAKSNNPKREGSKSAERFALYRSNMTVQQALDAGVSRSDILYDAQHNYISVAAAA